jgi:hypothetical protein
MDCEVNYNRYSELEKARIQLHVRMHPMAVSTPRAHRKYWPVSKSGSIREILLKYGSFCILLDSLILEHTEQLTSAVRRVHYY